MITSNICLMVMSISNLKSAALDSTFLHFFFLVFGALAYYSCLQIGHTFLEVGTPL